MGLFGQLLQKRQLSEGLRAFERDGQTPHPAYVSLRGLHCGTGGRSTDQLARELAAKRPASDEPAEGLLAGEQGAALAALERDGFYAFEQKLDSASCAALESFARRTEANLNPRPDGAPERALYETRAPLAPTYHFDEAAIIEQATVQQLISDPSFRQLARRYLGCEPVFDLAAMWWSAPATQASSGAAQLYHFDMDRVAWLKFFVYLSDVTPSRGPHCVLRGTHRTGDASQKLLSLGDRRIEDSEIQSLGLDSLETEICGGVGTILVVDTRAHHKGKPPQSEERLLLQLEFASSLFGAPFNRIQVEHPTPVLMEAARKAPQVFERLSLSR